MTSSRRQYFEELEAEAASDPMRPAPTPLLPCLRCRAPTPHGLAGWTWRGGMRIRRYACKECGTKQSEKEIQDATGSSR